MLRRATEIIGYNILAQDGEIGHVEDFRFDTNEVGETEWTVRYMVVDTGFWIFGRKVLISPDSLGTPDWDHKVMPVSLTKEQIENSPELDVSGPITRDYERDLRGYYGWPVYWGAPPTTPTAGLGYAGMATGHDAHLAAPNTPMTAAGREEVPEEVAIAMRDSERTHIHSLNDLTNFSVQASDGEFGTVKDVFIDDYNWVIRYLLIDTGDWFSEGRQVLIAPEWIEFLDFDDSQVTINLTKQQIEESPEYESGGPLDRDYEGRLYNYYGYRTYW